MPRYELMAVLFVLILMGSLEPSLAQDSQNNEVCDAIAPNTGTVNTDPDDSTGGVTVIGHLPDHNYVVVVPGKRERFLDDVRRYVPDAFMTSSRLGSYVHAGAFERRGDAERLSRQLRACDIRSRVVYFHRGRPI